MSTLQVSRQSVVVPGQSATVGLSQTRPRSASQRAASVAYGAKSGGDGNINESLLPNKRLDPIDRSKLSLSVLRQYNDLVGEDPGLTCRSLPPVKLSLKLSKTKFVDSPRETSSRILKPLLTMKTHTAGHHVFTEGISKRSKLPNPSFALPKLKVPYSNMPDSVMVYKEKNKFAFGVRNETNHTPYRLTPKPTTEVPGVQLHVSLPSETPRVNDDRDKRQLMSDRTVPTNAQQLKSNKIVLDPIASIPGNESVKSGSNASNSTGHPKEPIVPCNSTLGHESPQRKLVRRNSQADSAEGRLSIVSIGDTVAQNHFERHKRQTRKLYPMYDHKTRRDEYVKKAKFGGNFDYGSRRPEEPGSTFTYKVSSRSLEFAQSESGSVSPIKNNMRSRPPLVFSSSRGLGGFRRYTRDSNEYDASYQDQKARRLYRRMYYPPRSAGSNSSTDLSFLPANPPPSETSHIISEDIPQNLADFKNEMITLIEEREKTTVSLLSARFSEKRETTSIKDEDKISVNADNVLNDSSLETGRSDGNDTDTDIQMEAVMSKIVDERGFVKENALPEHPETIKEVSVDEVFQVKDNKKQELFVVDSKGSKPETEETKVHSLAPRSTVNNGQKQQLLSVPTFSLDKLSHHPLGQNAHERTSLSRSIQNLALGPDKRLVKSEIVTDREKDSADPDKIGSFKDCKVAVPVTKLRLFSDSSSITIDTPRVSLTDEHGEKFDINDYDETTKCSTSINEKRMVANSNIQFISPLVNDNKAKRQ